MKNGISNSNAKCRSPKEIRKQKPESASSRRGGVWIGASGFFRISEFDLRNSGGHAVVVLCRNFVRAKLLD